MTDLAAKAFSIAQADLAAGVRGHVMPMFGRFRGLRVDEYQRNVGLPLPPNTTLQGYPWCASAVYTCFKEASEALNIPNPCPRTGGAIKMWGLSPAACYSQTPQPGSVFVLDRGEGHGHVGFVEMVNGDGTITTVEPDTSNRDLSTIGDSWGRHTWNPADGSRGTVIGFLVY